MKNSKDKMTAHDFEYLSVIGRGSYGKVYEVRKKTDNKIYALKIMHKDKIIEFKLTNNIKNEKDVLLMADHPCILKLHYSF